MSLAPEPECVIRLASCTVGACLFDQRSTALHECRDIRIEFRNRFAIEVLGSEEVMPGSIAEARLTGNDDKIDFVIVV